ncbi:hypothetical protein RhiirA5_440635 [Rhizophagus irregularis]|uniref:Uncharacterized protein n=1 Tax=Rhizophagus irregularis TaxID=588596 RepID=A0A2N0NGJ8_9GLOM|nr:hypothetical protein RhiirA5_440635 [Rhizophagus irregularis]
MANNNNNPKTLDQLYEVLLYKKKDIIAIQEKLGISGNANQMANIKAKWAEEVNEKVRAYFQKFEEYV